MATGFSIKHGIAGIATLTAWPGLPRPAVEPPIYHGVREFVKEATPTGTLPSEDIARSVPGWIAEGIQQTSEASVRFKTLVSEWKAGRDPTAMSSRMVRHPAYRSIIRMGTEAIPLILEELRSSPDEWFYALNKITGENPVSDACRGRFRFMVDAWIRWGKENGYLGK